MAANGRPTKPENQGAQICHSVTAPKPSHSAGGIASNTVTQPKEQPGPANIAGTNTQHKKYGD